MNIKAIKVIYGCHVMKTVLEATWKALFEN